MLKNFRRRREEGKILASYGQETTCSRRCLQARGIFQTRSQLDQRNQFDRLPLSARRDPATRATRFSLPRLAIFFFSACLIFAIIGCASTTVTDNRQFLTGPRLPRPSHIWVYDFVASPADLPPGSFITEKELDTAPQTLEQIQAGRDLGSTMAGELVGQIQRTGLMAFHAQRDSKPELNDVVFRGYLISINEGSATKRVVLGFGAGRSELRTVVEGLQMTRQGLRPLGNATVESGGTKTPGASLGAATFLITANPVGLIVGGSIKAYNEASGRSRVTGRAEKTVEEIAKLLKQQFQEQGWIAQN